MAKTVAIIAPTCVEAGPQGGTASGLASAGRAFEDAGLLTRLQALGINVTAVHRPRLEDQEATGDPIADLGTYNGSIARLVVEAMAAGAAPMLTGGTCNHLPGMIGGIQLALGPTVRLGLLWLDAHGDFNTPSTTTSGMLGGMPVAVVSGLCHAAWREGAGIVAPLPTNRIMMIDVRNLDPAEEALVRATDVAVVRRAEVADMEALMSEVRRFAASVDALYVHIDADILDASLQPNHPTAEPHGFTIEQTLNVVQAAVDGGTVVAFGVVSVNPEGRGGDIALESGLALIAGGAARWLGSLPAYTGELESPASARRPELGGSTR